MKSEQTEKQLAARAMLVALSPQEAVEVLYREHQCVLHEQENAKAHPLVDFQLSPSAFDALCAHLTDGGGVTEDMAPSHDGKPLTLILWQAIHDRDQETFWRELPHLIKHWMAKRGLITRIPGTDDATIVTGLAAPPLFVEKEAPNVDT